MNNLKSKIKEGLEYHPFLKLSKELGIDISYCYKIVLGFMKIFRNMNPKQLEIVTRIITDVQKRIDEENLDNHQDDMYKLYDTSGIVYTTKSLDTYVNELM